MGIRVLQNAFNAGEVSPSMYGRIDDQKFSMGCATLRNFICQAQGPAVRRTGFKFVNAVKDSTKKVRLIPFRYNSDQTCVVELGNYYARFHSMGLTVYRSGAVHEITTPYAAEDLDGIEYTQSADVVTLVHTKYPPQELQRHVDSDGVYFTMSAISFAAEITAPTISSVTNTYTGETGQYIKTDRYLVKYVVTSVKDTADGTIESAPSASGQVQCNLYLNDSSNTITWGAVTGVDRYRVYKTYSGLYGYIGETSDTSFEDTNKDADSGITPPRWEAGLFASANNYPGAVGYFDQRRCFAGTIEKPKMIWMTRPGTETNFSYTIPSQDDNRIKFNIAAQEAGRINHLVPLSQLILTTPSSESRVQSVNSDALTPSSFSVKPQAYIGASNVHPQVFNSVMLYVAERGSHIRELGYSNQMGGYTTGDLSVRAAHLFDNDKVIDIALAKAPDQILWCVTRSGSLIGMTYMPDQKVAGWHRHDTDGTFESIAVVPEDDEDILYAVVKRKVNGSDVRYVERMDERYFASLEEAFYVDCGITKTNATATTSVTGLTPLIGKTVSILADGGVLPDQTVSATGTLTLPIAATKVTVGLPYVSDLKTLPAAYQAQDGSYGRGHMKNINKVFVRVYRSSGVFIGPDFDKLTEMKSRQDESYGVAPSLVSDEIGLAITPSWQASGQLAIRQTYPLPLSVVGITADFAQ